MGKRELGLIVGFVLVGVLVWQFTAPAAEGGGFSFGKLISEARREMRGRNASAEVTTTPAIPLDASVTELRLTLSGDVTIKGEDRSDIGAELRVVSDGFDEAEAKKLASEVGLKISRFADSLVVGWNFPDPGRQQPKLTLLVPKRLRIQLEGRGTAEVIGAGSVTLARQTGQLKLTSIEGLVNGESRGMLTVEGASAVDLSVANVETVLKGVTGDIRMNVRAGETRIEKAAGRTTITGTDTRVRVDGSSGELRAEMVEGELEFNDVSGPIEIDGRSTPVTLSFLKAAPAKVQVREGTLDLVLPKEAASYSLDVRAAGGDLRVTDPLQKRTEGTESVVTKSAGANAPSIFVRGNGTTITIR